MNYESLEESRDASTYISFVNLLTSANNDVNSVIEFIQSVKSFINIDSKYCTTNNFINALLIFTYPGIIPYESIPIILEILLDEGTVDNSEINDTDEFIITNETSLLNTARDLQQETTFNAQSLGFNIDSTKSVDEIIQKFIQSKTLHLSNFHNDINEISGLFQNSQIPSLQVWYERIVKPYGYYWSNYGNVYPDEAILFNKYLLLNSLQEKFDTFINPINRNHIQTIDSWMRNTILPIIIYYNEDIEPLQNWMFHQSHHGSILRKYGIWNICIKLLLERIDKSKLQTLISDYLASCYFYAFVDDTNISSMELTKTYDTILDTLKAIGIENSSPTPQIQIEDFSNFESFDDFASNKNPLSPLFHPKQVHYLYDALLTCQRLYPINKLTLNKFLHYKFALDDTDLQREVTKITSNITSSNWEQLLNSVELFKTEFIPTTKTSLVDGLLLERLYMANLFESVNELYDDRKIKLSTKEIYEITLEKFWDSIDQSTNINDKIGNLHNAKLCIDIFDKLILEKDLDHETREEIIRFKHLFKAIHSLKNFKIVVEKNKSFTPKQLLQYSGNIDDEKNCIKLINIILEQNPKSYLAFEKLFRIFNDLLLYFNNHDKIEKNDTNYYFNKLKTACIESSLVDNNFQYAYNQSIELFEHFSKSNKQNIENFWLTFYQVGKFVSPDWFESDDEIEHLEILIKQREILSLTISELNCGDNIKIILDQWSTINQQIENQDFKHKLEQIKSLNQNENNNSVGFNLQQPMNKLAKEIINDATNTTNNAGEKISNLFVSGLGWAIGAKK
ncbi:hypothetical protein KGF54_000059 [Candida jiufengensis]|uniref:uncharacterized protein n=1 Tax=Candida jiufengensis TaxID=497108 RepID=UPI0022251527|nr:uncharacterized protein KGF54_000059 [Candida jiufengensis]KAI5957131.1 hypothetical protein KGF54_000059 [Candida jiufengensis]